MIKYAKGGEDGESTGIIPRYPGRRGQREETGDAFGKPWETVGRKALGTKVSTDAMLARLLEYGDPSERAARKAKGPKVLCTMVAQPPDTLHPRKTCKERNVMKKQIATLKRRGLPVLLALTMCLSLLQVNAFAMEPGEDSGDSGLQLEVTVDNSREDTASTSQESSPEQATASTGQDSAPSQDKGPSADDPVAEEGAAAPDEKTDAGEVTGLDENKDGTGNDSLPAEDANEPVDGEEGKGETTEEADDAEETTPPPEVKVEETLDQMVQPPKDYTETEEGTYEQVSSNTEQSTTDEDYDNADNAEKTTTTTETKNQQKHEAIRDENGNITGYEVVNSKVETVTTVREEKKTERPNEAVTELPKLKEEDENGNSVVMDGDGKYIITEKTVDPETGVETIVVKTLEKGEDESWINTSVVTTTRTTEVKTTESAKAPITFQVVQDKDGTIYFTVPVTENSILHAGSIIPNVQGTLANQQIIFHPGLTSPEVSDDFIFALAGPVIQSSILIQMAGKGDKEINWAWRPENGNENDLKDVQIAVLVDKNGNLHYVYCADVNTTAKPGTNYDLDNLENAGYFQDEDTAAKLQAIAQNGYWGVDGSTDDLGSLQGLLEKLQEATRDGVISGLSEAGLKNWLTPGAAMAGTQAAIWAIANGKDGINLDDPFNSNWYTQNVDQNGSGIIGSANFDGKFPWREKAAKAVYDYLLYLANNHETLDLGETTDLIGNADIKDVKVTVKELDSAADAVTQTPSKYNTDVSFILDVERDKMFSDDLKVTILDPSNPTGEPLGVYDLVGENAKDVTYDPATKTYTLTNVILPNGTSITLKLSGTQEVQKNAYLVTAEGGADASQSFIAVEEGKKDVDLSFNLHFSVKDPENPGPDPDPDPEDPEKPGPEDPKDPPKDPETPPTDPEDPPVDIPDPDVPLVPGPDPEEPPVDIPDPDVPLTPAPPVVDVPDEDVPLAPRPTTPTKPAKPAKPQTPVTVVTTEIPDEDVPLADVPTTGDGTALWYALALAAAAGIAWVKLAEKKRGK